MLRSLERPARLRVPIIALFVLGCALLGAPSAHAITRDAVLTRAQSWADSPVPYSQSKYHLGYRTDCSGYVSMCWSTGTSWATSSFGAVTHRIPTAQLKPGDAMLKKGYHIRLFEGWVDATHTSYVAYEANTVVAVIRIHSFADDLAVGYVPTRYNSISDGSPPNDMLRNRSFDVWTRSWSSASDQPVWWTVSGPARRTLAVHRTDLRRTGRNSLALLNPGDDPVTFTELSQTASVAAGSLYRLSAWARGASDPAGVSLRITYLGAAGASLAETSTSGDRWSLDNASFRQMSAMTTAPAGAVNARVTVRLAGGTTLGAPGTSVTLDDISLARPQITVGIKPSKSSARVGTTVALSGSVSPASQSAVAATVYVQKPGSAWRRLVAAPLGASSGMTSTWRATFAFKQGMRKGIYRFRMTVPGFAGYLGATSTVASVRLR